MKHVKLNLVAFVLLSAGASAQRIPSRQLSDSISPVLKIKDESRFYVNVHGGYAFGLGSTFKFYPDDVRAITLTQTDNNPPVKNTLYQAPKKGLGQGLRIGVGFSYIVNDFLNVGMDIDYFQSTIRKTRDSSYSLVQTTTVPESRSYNERYTISYETRLLTFTPNVLFKAISRPNWYIYNKIGLVATFRPNSLQREKIDGKYSTSTQGSVSDSAVTTEKVYDWGIRNPSIGFMGGIGAQFKLVGNMRAFGEIQFSHLVFVVRDRTVSSFKVNNTEMVGTLPTMDRELRFERDLSSSDLNPNPNQPSRTIIQRIPITYVGAQVGIAYRF